MFCQNIDYKGLKKTKICFIYLFMLQIFILIGNGYLNLKKLLNMLHSS